MTEPLTQEEQDLIGDAYDFETKAWCWSFENEDSLFATAARIVAAREAAMAERIAKAIGVEFDRFNNGRPVDPYDEGRLDGLDAAERIARSFKRPTS